MSAWLERRFSTSGLKRFLKDKRPTFILASIYNVHPATIARLRRKYIKRTIKGEVRHINGRRVASTEYNSWQLMKNRCLNPKADDYRYYGARGITIVKRWLAFENFLADMGRKPSALLTLERKNVNGNYSKRNCVWAPRHIQSRNRTDSRFTENKVLRIRKLYATGRYRQVDLAAMYNSTQAAISQITRNAAWATRNGGPQ